MCYSSFAVYPVKFWAALLKAGQASEIRNLWFRLSAVKQPADGVRKLTGLRLWDQQKGRENRPGSESEWQISQMDTN